jgi:putative ABC transport system permease protein
VRESVTADAGPVGASTVVIGWGLAVALLIQVTLAVGATEAGSLGLARTAATAAVRTVLQLGAVSVVIVIVAVVRSLGLASGFLLVMFTIAAFTSAPRITSERSGLFAAVPIAAGTIPVSAVVVGTGAVPLRPAVVRSRLSSF